MNNYSRSFLEQTAKDYELTLEVVEQVARWENESQGLYELLEAKLKEDSNE